MIHPTTLILLFNHKLTLEQEQDAKIALKVKQFKTLPNDLQWKWTAISPLGELDIKPLNDICQWLSANSMPGDYVLIQGDFGATYYLVNFCLNTKLNPVYSTTERRARETMKKDGKIEKYSQFEHITFRKYRSHDG